MIAARHPSTASAQPAARLRLAAANPLLAGLLLAITPLTGAAAHGPWGMPNWDGPGGEARADSTRFDNTRSDDPREGHASATIFVAEGATASLGHGTIAAQAMAVPQDAPNDGNSEDDGPRDDVSPAAAPSTSTPTPPPPTDAIHGPDPSGRQQATYEAAVLDRLAHAGYNTAVPAAANTNQIVEVRIHREIAAPREARHKPVSGEMDVGVSNRGSGFGMALNIDLTKPRPALIATELDTRIRDAASGRALWEGRASILTREGDPHWGDDRIASQLAAALFDGFPERGSAHPTDR